MAETHLAMSRRHVREGLERIDRQEHLLAELERDGHAETAAQGRHLLATMRRAQAEAEQTLADLEKSDGLIRR